MRVLGVVLVGLLMAVQVARAQDVCPVAGPIDYPMREVLRADAAILSSAFFAAAPFDDAQSVEELQRIASDGVLYRQVIEDGLNGVSPLERDLRLLALLDHDALGGNSLVAVTMEKPSGLFDLWLDVLDRRGLVGQAAALRKVQAAFPVWGIEARERYLGWSDGLGGIRDRDLDVVLAAQAVAFAGAQPSVLTAAEELLLQDAEVAAKYQRRRAATDDDALMARVMAVLVACQGDWRSVSEADAAFGKIPEPQADLVLMNAFLEESLSGSTHQYFTNSSGTMAPQLQAALLRAGLPEHAAAVQTGMGLIATDYPRDTEDRRRVMAGFDDEQDNKVYDLTLWAEDGAIHAAMIKLAKSANLWPDVSR